MQEVVIAGAARTPFGLYRGSFADQRCQDLAAVAMKEAVARAGIDSAVLDACIYSEAMQSSLPANVGRHGWLLAGLAENPAGYTMNTLCAGAIQTMFSAFNKIIAGEYQGLLTGGVETNSQAPYYLRHPRYVFGPDNFCFHDMKQEIQINAQPVDLYGELTSAVLADTIASNYGFSRALLDEYAQASQAKAVKAVQNGAMKEVIAPIVKKVKKADVSFAADDGPKKAAKLEKLMVLPPINSCGTATTGNIAPLADGSASVIMLSANKANELGCKTLARVAGFGIAAGNPRLIEKTTVRSIAQALKYAGMELKDLDYIDMHEPSAAYSLAVAQLLGYEAAGKINVDGGSLAYGHAGAATGGAMVANMVYRLERADAKAGLVNVAALGGQSLSVVITK